MEGERKTREIRRGKAKKNEHQSRIIGVSSKSEMYNKRKGQHDHRRRQEQFIVPWPVLLYFLKTGDVGETIGEAFAIVLCTHCLLTKRIPGLL